VRCQDFARAFPGVRPDCKLGNVQTEHAKQCNVWFGFFFFHYSSCSDDYRAESSVQSTHSGDRWQHHIRSRRKLFQVPEIGIHGTIENESGVCELGTERTFAYEIKYPRRRVHQGKRFSVLFRIGFVALIDAFYVTLFICFWTVSQTDGLAFTGEIRVNEQLVLTCIHTIMAREHNRVAKELSQINPHWNDEMLYQVNNILGQCR